MSININWENLTSGDEGAALAESIRAFIHDRFQQVSLPRMIRSVHVHSFDFGTIAPEIELKDVSDPLPDFYDVSDAGEESEADSEDADKTRSPMDTFPPLQQDASDPPAQAEQEAPTSHSEAHFRVPPLQTYFDRRNSATQTQSPLDTYPFLSSRASTPGIPGGTANMSFFHPPLSAALHGHGHSQASPLAAMAGASLPSAWMEPSQLASVREHEPSLVSPGLASPGLGSTSAPPPLSDGKQSYASDAQPDRSVDDVQIVMHLRYAGDVKMTMTADILLDYPMPSFVGIPLQIKLTGLSFDGIAVVAYIRKKAHFCFLSPEDAEALVGHESSLHRGNESAQSPQEASGLQGGTHGPEDDQNQNQNQRESGQDQHEHEHEQDFGQRPVLRVGGLFEDIKVESEIGEKTSGKQVLKNVGKIEKFILEQVRSIFETEFVHPNFWTFLI